jgi:hypothetical protein
MCSNYKKRYNEKDMSIMTLNWGGDSKSKTIFKLQKSVIRIISRVGRLSSCRQLFKELDLLPFPCMYICELVCCIKSHFGELDQNSVVQNHNACQKLNLHVQFCRTNVVKNGVVNMGIRLYNRIPNKIREVEKIRQFKRVLRSYLVQHMFSRGIYVKTFVIRTVCLKMYDVSYVSNFTKRKNKELN